MTQPSRISTDIDFDKSGKQQGFLRLPYSSHRSAYGWIAIPIVVIKNGEGPTVLLMAGNHGDEYEGQVALITAAGAGIGKASAQIMAREGATVVAVDTDEARLAALESEFADGVAAGKVLARKADALDPKSVNETVAWTEQTCGRICAITLAITGPWAV